MARRVFCCTDNLLVLPVSGVFVALLGLVLLIIYLVARGITSSLHLVEGPVPTYVAALMLILAGTASIILLKKRHLALIVASVLLSIFDVIICIVLAVTTGLVSIPFLGSFSVCVLRPSIAECLCYVLEEGQSNGTVIIPGADTKHYIFNDVRNCGSIETTLADFLYTLCIVYGFGALGSLFTAVLSLLLICGERRSSKESEAEAPRSPSRTRRGQQNLLREEERTTTPNRNLRRQGSLESPAATSPQASVSYHREAEGTTATPGTAASGTRHTSRTNLPQNRSVQRSSSVNTTPASASGSRRPTTRYHSVAGAEGGRRNGSGQRPQLPVLVRGGYLQIRLDGPRIPVYTLHGTNEAYIALTDLPRLQLPALDQVPAYVPELPDLPNYEPPPYSPSANNISESPEGEQNVSGGVERTSSVRQRLNFEEEATMPVQDAESANMQDATIDESPYIPLALTVSGEAVSTLQDTGSARTDDQRDLGHDQSLGVSDGQDRPATDISDDRSSVNGGDVQLIDSQPPDILVEAIESARSSLNVTASNVGNNLTSDSTESGISLPAARGNDDRGDRGHDLTARPGQWSHPNDIAERSCQVVPGPSSDSSTTSGDNCMQLAVTEECSTDDQSTDRYLQSRLDSRNIPCGNSEEQSSDPQGVIPNRSRSKSAAATSSNAPPRHHTDERGYGSQSRSSKSRRPKRHSSAKDVERPRGRDHNDKHRSRSRSPNKDTMSRESGKSTHKVQRWHSIQNDEERRPKKSNIKSNRRNTEDYGNPLRSRRYAASSTENLSDIINLVETVRGTSSQHSAKRHREQKKKSKSKVGLVDSKV